MDTNNANRNDFNSFMDERLKASTAFVEGNFEPLKEMSTTKSPATIFPPPGNYITGAAEVNRFNEQGANNFLPGAENEFDVFHQDADEHLAYWTGIQRSKVKMRGKPGEATFNLRITEVFRKEEGKWKLIHRHADPLQEN